MMAVSHLVRAILIYAPTHAQTFNDGCRVFCVKRKVQQEFHHTNTTTFYVYTSHAYISVGESFQFSVPFRTLSLMPATNNFLKISKKVASRIIQQIPLQNIEPANMLRKTLLIKKLSPCTKNVFFSSHEISSRSR